MNSETQPYYDWIFSRRERLVTPVGYKVTAIPISRVPGELPSDGKSDYPVRPTHQLQIDFGTATKGATVLLFVAQAGGAWREVLPCPRSDVVAQAKANQIAGQQLAEKVDTLVRGMPVELRAEITALLQAGRKVDAIKRYTAATHEDLSTAKSVIESLESR